MSEERGVVEVGRLDEVNVEGDSDQLGVDFERLSELRPRRVSSSVDIVHTVA